MKVLVKKSFGMNAPNTTTLNEKEECGNRVSQEKEYLKQSYATTISNVCVREGHSKDSKTVTTLEYGTVVFVLETQGNRAKICFSGQEIGWCTIYFEKEQRFLLHPCKNQNKGKKLFDAQDMDPVDIYEQEYCDYGDFWPYHANVKMNKLKTNRQKSKALRRLQQSNKVDNSRGKPNYFDGTNICEKVDDRKNVPCTSSYPPTKVGSSWLCEHEFETFFAQYSIVKPIMDLTMEKIVKCIKKMKMIEEELIENLKNVMNKNIKDEKLSKLITEIVRFQFHNANLRESTPGMNRFLDESPNSATDYLQYFEKYNKYVDKKCGICCDNDNPGSLILIHDFRSYGTRCQICEGCLESYVRMMYGKELKNCPCMGCNSGFTIYDLQQIAPAKIFNDYKESLWISKLKVCHDIRFCPNEKCGTGIQLPRGCCEAEDIICPTCDYKFCPQCYGPSHSEVGTCLEFLSLSGASQSFRETKQCPFCFVWIEKNDGCDHMTCDHCRNEFCWRCMGDYHNRPVPRDPKHCHGRVVRPSLRDVVRSARFTCFRMHPLHPMFAPKCDSYTCYKKPTCAECKKELCEYDLVYACRRCKHYMCTKCAGDTKPPLLCTLKSDVIVRNDQSLDSDIKYVLKKGTIVSVKSTSKYLREEVNDNYYYNGYGGYGFFSLSRHNRRSRPKPSYVHRAQIKFCHFKSSYGWCSLVTKNKSRRGIRLTSTRQLLEPHHRQEEALRIFKTQNFETPLYSSPEIQKKVQEAKRGLKQRILDPKPEKEEDEVIMPAPKLYSDGVLNHRRKPCSDGALAENRTSKSFRKQNYYKTRRRGRVGIPAKLIRKTRSRKRQNCRDHKFAMM